jgi:hypothetical protein
MSESYEQLLARLTGQKPMEAVKPEVVQLPQEMLDKMRLRQKELGWVDEEGVEEEKFPVSPVEGYRITRIAKGKNAGKGWNAVYAPVGCPYRAGDNRVFLAEVCGDMERAYLQGKEWCRISKVKQDGMREPKEGYIRRWTGTERTMVMRWMEVKVQGIKERGEVERKVVNEMLELLAERLSH